MEDKSVNNLFKLDTCHGLKLYESITASFNFKIEAIKNHEITIDVSFDRGRLERSFMTFLEESFKTFNIPVEPEEIKVVRLKSGFHPGGPNIENSRVLTPKEIEVLDLIVEGNCDKEIADLIKMKIFTLKTHLKTIFIKLNARNRTDAAIKYLKSMGRIKSTYNGSTVTLSMMGHFEELN